SRKFSGGDKIRAPAKWRKHGACLTSRPILFKRMSEHKITLTWKRGDTPFEYQKYSRDHTWKFDGGGLHRVVIPLRPGPQSAVTGDVPHRAGSFGRLFAAIISGRVARIFPAGPAWQSHGFLGNGDCGCSGHGPGSRRLA